MTDELPVVRLCLRNTWLYGDDSDDGDYYFVFTLEEGTIPEKRARVKVYIDGYDSDKPIFVPDHEDGVDDHMAYPFPAAGVVMDGAKIYYLLRHKFKYRDVHAMRELRTGTVHPAKVFGRTSLQWVVPL